MQYRTNNQVITIDFNGNLNGIDINFDCVHKTLNSAILAGDIDLTEPTLSIFDKVDQEYIYQGGLKEFAIFLDPLSWTTNEILAELGTIYKTKGVASYEKRSLIFPLDLPIMSGNFKVELRLNSVFGANLVDTSQCGMRVIPSNEVAEFDTRYLVDGVPTGSINWVKDYPDGTNRIGLVDFTAPSQETDTYPWGDVTFKSDQLNYFMRIQDLQAVAKTEKLNAEVENGANITVAEYGTPMTNVALRVLLQTANLTAGTQFVIAEVHSVDLQKNFNNAKKAVAKELVKTEKIIKVAKSSNLI